MKRIKTLSADNMAGQKFSHQLAPVTLFTGRNRAGKTTRMNAAMLVLAGRVPGLNTGKAVFDAFATGNPLEVGGVMDDKTAVARTWTQNKGAVKYQGPTEEQFPPPPPVMLDAMEFFGLSDAERVKFVFSRAKLPESFTVERMVDAITSNLKNIKLDEHTPESEAAIRETVDFISNHAGHSPLDDPIYMPQTWLVDLVASIKDRSKLANQNAKRMEQTVQGLAQVKQAAAVPQDAEARLAKAREELEAANADVVRLTEVGKWLRREHDAATKAAAAPAVDEAATRKEITELEAARSDARAAKPPGDPPAFRQMNEPRPTDVTARLAWSPLVEAANASHRAKADAELDVKQVATDIAKAEEQTTCPTCGQDITAKQKRIVAELKKKLVTAKQLLAGKSKEHAANAKKESEALERVNEAQAAIKAWDEAKAKLDEQNRRAAADWNALSANYSAAQKRANEIGDRIAKLTSMLTDRSAAEAAARLPNLNERLAEARTQYEAAKMTAERCRAAVDAAADEARRLMAERADAASRSKTISEAAKFRAEVAVLKGLAEMLADLQAEIVRASVGPIVASANALFAEVIGDPLEYRDGEIVLASKAGRVGIRSMSGAERAMACCAMSLALAAEAPMRIAFVDEVSRLDADNKIRCLEAIIRLVESGALDQALLVDTSPEDYYSVELSDTFKIISL